MKDKETMVVDICLTRELAALLALALLIVAGLGYLAWNGDEVAASAPQAPLASSAGMRQYYLTVFDYTGSEADGSDGNGAGVCAEGYHFASLWEILDPSNLKYNTTLGPTGREDSGQGPPSYMSGWVRTGWEVSTSSTVGRGNCNLWSSNDSGHYGTSAYLPHDWTTATGPHVWVTNSRSCNTTPKVWCVADTVGGSIYLPIVMKNY